MKYQATLCDDGSWMVDDGGDVYCIAGQGDSEAKARMIADCLNTLKPNLINWIPLQPEKE